MSAAAGASPPPPPPPPRNSPFDDLPAELLLMLYGHLGIQDFINLALVIYPTLLRHQMVPELTTKTAARIVTQGKSQCRLAGPSRMPVELWLHIASYLEPANSIALHFALGPGFWRFPGTPSQEWVTWLRVWSRRSQKTNGENENMKTDE